MDFKNILCPCACAKPSKKQIDGLTLEMCYHLHTSILGMTLALISYNSISESLTKLDQACTVIPSKQCSLCSQQIP